MEEMQRAMDGILDFTQPMNVPEFERICSHMSGQDPHAVMAAQEQLTRFVKGNDSFTRVDAVLEQSQDPVARCFALQALDTAVQGRWYTLPREQCVAIRNFMVGFIMELTRAPQANQLVLRRANSTLVAIATREWPTHWPTFVQEVVSSCGNASPLAVNNLELLRLLVEDVFVFRSKRLTQRWVERKRQALRQDLESIGALCTTVLRESPDAVMVERALQCLEHFIPVFGADAIDDALLASVCNYGDALPVPVYRCLTEIALLKRAAGVKGEAQARTLDSLFNAIMERIVNGLPTDVEHLPARVELAMASAALSNTTYVIEPVMDQVTQFVTAFLRGHMAVLRTNGRQLIVAGHHIVQGMLRVNSRPIFKTCVDYLWWLGNWLVRPPAGQQGSAAQVKMLLQSEGLLSGLRVELVRHMAKPEEVIIVEDESGEVYREHMKDVEVVELYLQMRETLVFFTHLEPKETESLMLQLMARQVDRSEWSRRNLNHLSWAFGAISGAFGETAERSLLVQMLRDLLTLCSEMSGKANRAVIASDIMYVVGQYPRFLCQHPRFLRTVVNKLFEFMKEHFPGVMDMAVDTFLKINKNCAHVFWDHAIPGCANEMLGNVAAITAELSPPQSQLFYEAMGYIVKAAPPPQERPLQMLLEVPNQIFSQAVATAAQDFAALCTPDAMMHLLRALRTISRVAKTCGGVFIEEMHAVLFWNIINFYKTYSQVIAQQVAQAGVAVLTQQHVKLMRLLKKEMLRIVELFVANTNDANFVAEQCVPSLVKAVIEDYQASPAGSRDAQVLATVTACLRALKARMQGGTQHILALLFDSTVELITVDAKEFPEHRVNLFQMLDALIEHCFPEVLAYSRARPDLVRGLMWAAKHIEKETMTAGLKTCCSFVTQLAQHGTAEDQPVLGPLLVEMLTDALVSMLDSLHEGAFAEQCALVNALLLTATPPGTPGAVFGYEAVVESLQQGLKQLPTLSEQYVQEFPQRLFALRGDLDGLRQMLSDFLVEVQVWGAEQEEAVERQQDQASREAQVVGLARPEDAVRYGELAED